MTPPDAAESGDALRVLVFVCLSVCLSV